MKPQPTLFDLPEPDKTRSTAARIDAFCSTHGILTHFAKHCRPDCYMALWPYEEHKGKDICTIMAEYARFYEETNRVTTAPSRLSAVRALCKLQNIPCDL